MDPSTKAGAVEAGKAAAAKGEKAVGSAANGEGGKAGDAGNAGGEEPFLGSWKTKADAAEGLKNLQTKLSEQGNLANTLRAQLESSQAAIQDLHSKLQGIEAGKQAGAAEEADKALQAEQKKITEQIKGLDPVDEDYSSKLVSLINKSNALAAQRQHQETLAAATNTFKKELDERDIRNAQQEFYRKNPDFATPEMQAQIKQYMDKDETGMSDPLVAYREIQRDMAVKRAQELEAQNLEMQNLLNLKKGTDETGTVIQKGQGNQGGQTKPKKVTGAERDKGMLNVLRQMREAGQ